MAAGTNGKNGVTPAYKDKIEVKNKITFFPRTDLEFTVLMHPHVGRDGRKKDMRLISLAQGYRREDGQGIDFMAMLDADESYQIIAEGADAEDHFEFLDQNMTFGGWARLAMRVFEYRQLGEEIYEFEEALEKSEAGSEEVAE